jgi:hypothetical protein
MLPARGGGQGRCWMYASRQGCPVNGRLIYRPPQGQADRRREGQRYRKAGFHEAGRTKGGLLALQLLPDDMPKAEAARGSQLVLV